MTAKRMLRLWHYAFASAGLVLGSSYLHRWLTLGTSSDLGKALWWLAIAAVMAGPDLFALLRPRS